jgi:hypothetical protein
MATDYTVSFIVTGRRELPPPTAQGDFLTTLTGKFLHTLAGHGYELGTVQGVHVYVSRPPAQAACYNVTIAVTYPDGEPFPAADRPEAMLGNFRNDLENSGWIIDSASVSQAK